MIFTSHDRHFMHRVATHVIEVRAGRVASYPGDYDEYVYRVQTEIDSGLRAPHATGQPASVPPRLRDAVDRKARARADRDAQKKLKAVERKIARLDEEKRAVSEKLLTVTDAAEAQRLHVAAGEADWRADRRSKRNGWSCRRSWNRHERAAQRRARTRGTAASVMSARGWLQASPLPRCGAPKPARHCVVGLVDLAAAVAVGAA